MYVISRNLGCSGDSRETPQLAMPRSEVPLAILYPRVTDLLGDGEGNASPRAERGSLIGIS